MSGIIGKFFRSFVQIQWKFLLLSIPTALAAYYVMWTLQSKRNEKKVVSLHQTNSLVEESIDEAGEEQPLVSNISLSTVPVTQMGVSHVKPYSSPTDSGYQEPSSPLKQVFGKHHPCHSTPCSLASMSPTINTTFIIRGGRARTAIQLPIDIIGRFIGRQGKNIKSLMTESGAQIHIQQKNLSKDATIVPCILQGTQFQINKAIDLICLRHPEVSINSPSLYVPALSVCTASPNSSESSWNHELKPPQTPSNVFLAIVTYIEKLNRIWLIPFSSSQLLEELHQSMACAYKAEDLTSVSRKDLAKEDMIGKFCAVRVNEVYWLRGKIIDRNDSTHFEVKLMDYGSSVIVLTPSLKPLRKEHTLIPIQSLPFMLSNVQPIKSDSEDGMLVLQALVEGSVLEAHPTGALSPDDQTPYLELYTQAQYGSDCQAFINRELVNQGFAAWSEVSIESPNSSPSSSPVICDTLDVDGATFSAVTRGDRKSSLSLPKSVKLSDLLDPISGVTSSSC